MRLFLRRLLLFFLIPVLLLAVLYMVTDPYKTLRPFSLDYFDATNRDYLSSELFLMNYPEQKYDSFIFASSRGGGINTYHWASYLPEGSKQYMFQAWSETVGGIEQKIQYIVDHKYPLNNALILLDVPDVFDPKQFPTDALSIKDSRISRQPVWLYQSILFYDFVQKPSQWIRAFERFIHPVRPVVGFDEVSNDWLKTNKELDLSVPPQKDSLNNMSPLTKAVFLKGLETSDDLSLVSPPLITPDIKKRLIHIREMFQEESTDYRIVVSPGFYQSSQAISPSDLDCLRTVFGKDRVYDFSGKSDLNTDYNNFSDPTHFGLYVGWHIIEQVYGNK